MSEMMSLVAETGRDKGTRPSNRLRVDGMIPGVVYGKGTEPVAIAVNRRELRLVLSGPSGHNAVITLDVAGTKHPTVVKDMQRHPVKRTVNHVDFLVVDLDVEITAEVPVVLEGEATQVNSNSGIVDHQLTSITVLAKPNLVPGQIVIDITDMTIGDVIRASDLPLPEGVSLAIDPDALVVQGSATRLSATPEEEEAAEGGEGEESGEAEAE